MLLVTGITGHSGRFFAQELINHKYNGKIRCVVQATSDTSLLDNSNLNIEKVVGSFKDQKFMNSCMNGVDTVFHIGGILDSPCVMMAAVKNNVKRAILVHTTGIYSKYKSASEGYKNAETIIKELIKNTSMGLVILRPTMIYGNIKDKNMVIFIKMVDKLRLFPIIDNGMSLLQPVNGRDLGKAYYQVLTNDKIMNGDYILSGKDPITMIDMFKLISHNLNKKTAFVNVSVGTGVLGARILKTLSLGKVDYVEKVQRMGENRSYPHDNAARDFGYDPMPFTNGLQMEIEQYVRECKLG